PEAAGCGRRNGSRSTYGTPEGCSRRRWGAAGSRRCRAARSRPTPRCGPTSRRCTAPGSTGRPARAARTSLPAGPDRSCRRRLVEPPRVLVEDLPLRLDAQVLAPRQLVDVLGEVVVPVGDVAGVEDDVVAEPADHLGDRLL